MNKKDYKYIYGPVPSWRLGSSLGIDPVSYKEKICSFDCTYCQLGRTKVFSDERRVFIPVAEIINELHLLPPLKIDYITFSGSAEPTLAKNLGEMIESIKEVRNEKVAVLTNSSLLDRKDVQEDLLSADCVVAKLDAYSQEVFDKVNRPMPAISFDRIIKGLNEFRRRYKGKFALQIMFTDENKVYAKEIAHLARNFKPDEIQLNTPLRPCSVTPLSRAEMGIIGSCFERVNAISVYDAEKKKVRPVSKQDTLRRRGKI